MHIHKILISIAVLSSGCETATNVSKSTLNSSTQILRNALSQPPKTNPFTELITKLEGCSIIADDGTFLGIITTNQFEHKSILNEFGPHGSEFQL